MPCSEASRAWRPLFRVSYEGGFNKRPVRNRYWDHGAAHRTSSGDLGWCTTRPDLNHLSRGRLYRLFWPDGGRRLQGWRWWRDGQRRHDRCCWRDGQRRHDRCWWHGGRRRFARHGGIDRGRRLDRRGRYGGGGGPWRGERYGRSGRQGRIDRRIGGWIDRYGWIDGGRGRNRDAAAAGRSEPDLHGQ